MYPKEVLDQLRQLLKAVNVSDDHLKRGVRLTKAGIAKVAAKFEVTEQDVEGMLNSLSMAVLKEDAPRFSFEEDFIGNITLRDAKSGRDKFIQGDEAFKLSDELSANPDREEEIIAQYFDVENLNEFANPSDGIVSDRGTFNFPYKGKFATAIYGLDKAGVFLLNVESLRDAEDIESDITPSMREELNKIALKWVDKV